MCGPATGVYPGTSRGAWRRLIPGYLPTGAWSTYAQGTSCDSDANLHRRNSACGMDPNAPPPPGRICGFRARCLPLLSAASRVARHPRRRPGRARARRRARAPGRRIGPGTPRGLHPLDPRSLGPLSDPPRRPVRPGPGFGLRPATPPPATPDHRGAAGQRHQLAGVPADCISPGQRLGKHYS